MPPVFDNKARTDLAPLRRGETLYAYYDKTGRHGSDQFRDLIDQWVMELPSDERAEVVQRMRGGTDKQFEAALVELIAHATFLRLGYRIEPHPVVPNTSRRPDFLVRDAEGVPLFYAEATTINPATEEVAHDNREATLHTAINRASIPPDMRIGYALREAGTTSPRSTRFVAEIERWARDSADAVRNGQSVRHVFSLDGWSIDLTLHGGFAANPSSRNIAAESGRVRFLGPAQDLRSAVELKARRYGRFDLPYIVIVADRTDSLAWSAFSLREDVTEAVLGDEVIEDRMSVSGQVATHLVRRGGLWFLGGRPAHQNVSGVLVVPDTSLWKLRDDRRQPLLALNPWAERPLDEDVLPLPRLVARDDRWQFVEGRAVADVLSMPDPWPPEGA